MAYTINSNIPINFIENRDWPQKNEIKIIMICFVTSVILIGIVKIMYPSMC